MAYFLNPLLANNLQKKQDVFKGSFFIKLEDGSEIDAKELIESIEDITSELNQKLDVKLSKANAILITNNNGNITPVEGVVMQQAERDKLASLQVNAISNKIQSDNSYVETSGDTINAFANKLQSGRFPDTTNSENLLVVGNGASEENPSNAMEVTYSGKIIAKEEVQVGEHKLTEKVNNLGGVNNLRLMSEQQWDALTDTQIANLSAGIYFIKDN